MEPRARTEKSGRFGVLTLKRRLLIVFGGLLVVAIAFCALLLVQQHRIAIKGSVAAVAAHDDMVDAMELRESLTELDRQARMGEVSTTEIAHFRRVLSKVTESVSNRQEFQSLISEIDRRFADYVSSLNRSRNRYDQQLVRASFEDVMASVGAFIDLSQNSVYSMAQGLRAEQERATKLAFLFLVIFIAVMVVTGFKMISIITQPLSSLAGFLDRVDVEDSLPSSVPVLGHVVPEVALVAGKLEQLLHRLRGYRALNVRRLLIEKRRADVIAASIADGIFLLRGEEILYANPTAERIVGVSSGMLAKGVRLSSMARNGSAGKESHGAINRGAEAVLTAVSRTIPVEYSVETDGRRLHYLLQAYPISYDLVEQVEHSFSGGNIEQIIDRFQANTMVLAQDVTLVKESQEAKGHFVATLAHEVKTPVTSLTMATRLLKKSLEQFPNPTHRALITTCAEDVDRLRVLLEDLLTISRFDTLTQRLEIQSIDLGKLVRHSLQSFQSQANERGVELIAKVQSGGRPVIVPMDPTKIAWALSNLMTNALRHTPRGGHVEAIVTTTDDAAEVRIRDSGPGIDRKRQEKIFDKFNPYYDLRVARSGSAGVGLAIAREIVVAHGGRIWVSSEPGQGAEFSFTLPNRSKSSSLQNEMMISKGADRGAFARG